MVYIYLFKKSMLKNILFVFCSIFVLSTYAQIQTDAVMGYQDYRRVTESYYIRTADDQKYKMRNVEGSLFLYDDFKLGSVYDVNADKQFQTFLRYDVFNDVFEIRLNQNSDELKTLKRSPNYQYTIDNKKFVLINSTSAINEEHYISGNGYVEELTNADEEAVLYKRYYMEFNEGVKATSTYQTDTPPSLELKQRYIIKFNDDYKRADDHRKRIIDAFPDHQAKIKKFIKSNKHKFRGDEQEIQNQMIETVQYYNSLK